MNSFQLECFFCVASTLNFARAAEKLNVTQPAVTHQIRTLENELNTVLFNRSTRNVALTQAGEMLLPEVKDLIVRFNSIRNKFSKADAGMYETFQIACTNDTLYALLPDVLFDLASEHPNVHPFLRTVFASQLIKCLDENFADVALGIKEKLPKGSSIVYTEILHSPLVCLCDSTHPLSESKEVSLAQLNEYPLIFFRPTVCSTEIIALQLQAGKNRSAENIYLCDDLAAAITLVRAGFGVVLLPRIFMTDFVPDTVRIPVADVPAMSFGVYYKPNESIVQKSFIRLLKAHTEALENR